MYNLLHPKADIDRLYVRRANGGRRKVTFKIGKKWREQYFGKESQDKCINTEITGIAKKLKHLCKENINKDTEGKWTQKQMHGQYNRETNTEQVDRERTLRWLRNGTPKEETESIIVASQDQAISIIYIKHQIHRQKLDPKCRLCKEYDETIKHMTTVLAKYEYIKRQNKVCSTLHYNICKYYNIEVEDKWFKHKPKNVELTKNVTVIWDTQDILERPVCFKKIYNGKNTNQDEMECENKKSNFYDVLEVSLEEDKKYFVEICINSGASRILLTEDFYRKLILDDGSLEQLKETEIYLRDYSDRKIDTLAKLTFRRHVDYIRRNFCHENKNQFIDKENIPLDISLQCFASVGNYSSIGDDNHKNDSMMSLDADQYEDNYLDISRDCINNDKQIIIDNHKNDSMMSLDADRDEDLPQDSIDIRSPEFIEQQTRPQRI
ncbi:unnamed protein product [Ceutorhynchus assimilis]|uniref:Uncharacterized protein n=1 Tax=Ceutorhynchus assimilis TaxID=467358 RepID=A0A9N9QQK1_9CUCU|nr:unnamed protein product [Ceutorhynchus assimilis]